MTDVAGSKDEASLPSRRYAHYVLAVMVIMYTCNYLDRFVLTIMITDIKADLEIFDTMVGFLMGPAFAQNQRTDCGTPQEQVQFQGLPCRICWLGYDERHKAGLRFNEMVRDGEVDGPIVIGRDHLDCGSVASPNRETGAHFRWQRSVILPVAAIAPAPDAPQAPGKGSN